MAWARCKNGWCKDSKEVIGRQTRRREEERKIQIKVDIWCPIGLEKYECKTMENKNSGQNRMGICQEGSKGQK